MSPDIERCPGGAPGGASASSQGGADIDGYGSAPWRAIPSHPEGRKRPACPGPRQRIRAIVRVSAKLGWKLGCLTCESVIEACRRERKRAVPSDGYARAWRKRKPRGFGMGGLSEPPLSRGRNRNGRRHVRVLRA